MIWTGAAQLHSHHLAPGFNAGDLPIGAQVNQHEAVELWKNPRATRHTEGKGCTKS